MSAGLTLWFTGLSGAGKTTVAAATEAILRQRQLGVEVLDGDVVRTHLSKGLGFSREDRDINIRRIAWVAAVLTRHGVTVLAAAISPYRAVRDEARTQIGRFIEVFCDAPMDVLTARDTKGLYKKALAGEIKNFTGVNDPYEAPIRPEVHLRTAEGDAIDEACVVIRTAEILGYLPTGTLPRRVDDDAIRAHLGRVERMRS